MTQLTAKARYLRISPRKMRAVADLVRGMKVPEAIEQLRFAKRGASEPMSKLLRSALANAENNFSLVKESLRIKRLTVDGGPVLKRFQPRAYGRAVPIRHRTSHVTVVIEGQPAPKRKVAPVSHRQTKSAAPAADKEAARIEKTEPSVFKAPKKVGEERQPSFVRRFFRRKSI